MDEYQSTVYVLLDGDKIVDINSSDFLQNTTGWTAIDQGYGDKYKHAYSHYLPGRPLGKDKIALWRLSDGRPVKRTDEEIAADRAAMVPPVTPQEQLRADVDFLAAMTGVSL